MTSRRERDEEVALLREQKVTLERILEEIRDRKLPKVHLGVLIPGRVGKLCEGGNGPAVFTLNPKLVTCVRCKRAIERRALALATERLKSEMTGKA